MFSKRRVKHSVVRNTIAYSRFAVALKFEFLFFCLFLTKCSIKGFVLSFHVIQSLFSILVGLCSVIVDCALFLFILEYSYLVFDRFFFKRLVDTEHLNMQLVRLNTL